MARRIITTIRFVVTIYSARYVKYITQRLKILKKLIDVFNYNRDQRIPSKVIYLIKSQRQYNQIGTKIIAEINLKQLGETGRVINAFVYVNSQFCSLSKVKDFGRDRGIPNIKIRYLTTKLTTIQNKSVLLKNFFGGSRRQRARRSYSNIECSYFLLKKTAYFGDSRHFSSGSPRWLTAVLRL